MQTRSKNIQRLHTKTSNEMEILPYHISQVNEAVEYADVCQLPVRVVEPC